MKMAQDYMGRYSGGEARGGFNSRLYGDSRSKTMDGIPSPSERWGQRNAGWELADSMIWHGKIFSRTKIGDKEIEFKCYMDGDAWCCVGPGFVDLQESDEYAFGETREEAIKSFSKQPWLKFFDPPLP